MYWLGHWPEIVRVTEDYRNTYPPLNGGSPDISWYTIQPNAHRSELFKKKNPEKSTFYNVKWLKGSIQSFLKQRIIKWNY